MAKTSLRTRIAVPLLALVFAFAFAPAAFAAQDASVDLKSMALQIQEDAVTDEGDVPTNNNGIGADLERAVLTVTTPNQVYTGKEIFAPFTVTLDGKPLVGSTDFQHPTADYFYFYMNNVTVGDSTKSADERPQVVVATFSDEEPYVYIKEGFFTIAPCNMKNVTAKAAAMTYTGKPLKPPVTVTYNGMTLVNGRDYSLAYSKNTKVGKGKVTITGKGNYTGKKTIEFTIKKATIADAKFSKVKDQTYNNGKLIKPAVKVKFRGKMLKAGKDYQITYKKNKNVGLARIVIKGKRNLKGKHTIYFAINPASLSKCSIYHGENYTWTGNWIYPSVSIKYKGKSLKSNKDYIVRYKDNRDVGKGYIYVSGRGNFTGDKTYSFNINKRYISDSSVEAWTPYRSYKYTGNPIEPLPVLRYNGRTLVYNNDYYIVSYENNIGSPTQNTTARVVIGGSGSNFQGTRAISFTIEKTQNQNSGQQ